MSPEWMGVGYIICSGLILWYVASRWTSDGRAYEAEIDRRKQSINMMQEEIMELVRQNAQLQEGLMDIMSGSTTKPQERAKEALKPLNTNRIPKKTEWKKTSDARGQDFAEDASTYRSTRKGTGSHRRRSAAGTGTQHDAGRDDEHGSGHDRRGLRRGTVGPAAADLGEVRREAVRGIRHRSR